MADGIACAGAAVRNAARWALPVPTAPTPFAHVVTMGEQDDFRPSTSIQALTSVDVSLR